MSVVEVIISAQKCQFFLPMLEGRERNEPQHQSKRHETYNDRFLKFIVENEEEEMA